MYIEGTNYIYGPCKIKEKEALIPSGELPLSFVKEAVREVDDVPIGRYEQAQKRGNSMKL